MSRPLFAGAIVVLSAGLAWWALGKQEPSDGAATAIADEPAAAAAREPMQRPSPSAPPRVAQTVLPDSVKASRDESLDKEATLAANEAAWAREPSSPQAAAAMEDKFRLATASEGVTSVRFTPRSVQVQCRATVCRLESEFPTRGTSAEWALRVQLALGGSVLGNVVTIPEQIPGGGEKLVMFAYMPGHRPPG
jgi:hypothetical protein